MSHSGNGDLSPEPIMHIDSIRFVRLFPPNKEAGPKYGLGVALFLGSAENGDNDYLLTLSERDTRQLASDLNAFLEGRIDISNKEENYGNSQG